MSEENQLVHVKMGLSPENYLRTVDRRLVVVDAAARNAAEHAESMIVSVEQHLVRLQEIGSSNEGPGIDTKPPICPSSRLRREASGRRRYP